MSSSFANLFNKNIVSAAGDNVILPGTKGYSWKVSELAIQNLDSSLSTRVIIKDSQGDVALGPVLLSPGQLLNIEVGSHDVHQPMIYVPSGLDLVINSSAGVELTIFGVAGLV